jgi:hypothetical protein
MMNGNTQKYVIIGIVGVVATGIGGSVIRPQDIATILGFCSATIAILFSILTTAKGAAVVAAKVEEAKHEATAAASGVAKKAEEVKQALVVSNESQATQLAGIAEVGVSTHALCNAAMLEQKRMYMVKCETSAAENPSLVNVAEARAAKEAYENHLAQMK